MTCVSFTSVICKVVFNFLQLFLLIELNRFSKLMFNNYFWYLSKVFHHLIAMHDFSFLFLIEWIFTSLLLDFWIKKEMDVITCDTRFFFIRNNNVSYYFMLTLCTFPLREKNSESFTTVTLNNYNCSFRGTTFIFCQESLPRDLSNSRSRFN